MVMLQSSQILGTMRRGHFVPAKSRKGIHAPTADPPWEVYYHQTYDEYFFWNEQTEESTWLDPAIQELDDMIAAMDIGEVQNIGQYVDDLIAKDWILLPEGDVVVAQPHDNAPLEEWARYCWDYYQRVGGEEQIWTVSEWKEHFEAEGYPDGASAEAMDLR